MDCARCHSETPSGGRFCTSCGTALGAACSSCGAALADGHSFCGQCGTAAAAAGDAAAPPPRPSSPVAERRRVSVLFADLVGFTTFSEGRDAEEVRELLTRYFDVSRSVVARYGGTVEKFIGDAVMAVWGTPLVHEDDAERAVRAALDLVAAVTSLGEDLALPGLAARAGVTTGTTAVTLGATGQGMVAGDTVNTAARLQSAAPPGCVLVDGATRAATVAAVAYEDAGELEVKGRQERVRAHRPVRVVASVGGVQRIDGLEPPFSGRAHELRLVQDLFHATADSGRARLLLVSGVAGVGKSRLAWEFEKHVDGITVETWWHSGRCLPYGEGVAFWALAEMVRMRFRISEDDPSAIAAEKIRSGLVELVPDARDRDWLAPRLGVLLGLPELGDGSASSREELFGAWRLLFETLARSGPVVLLVEELQSADAGLLDFLDHLLDWSRDLPVFVLALARPEFEDRRPGWGTGRRNATALYLEPLPDAAMQQVVDGLVPGLPARVRQAVVTRAEGLPLYAVETVRMLVDRDLVVPRAGNYVLADGAAARLEGTDLAALGVPPSLSALIAARLDALPDAERRLVSDASVLGVSFPRDHLRALAALDDSGLDRLLTTLVRKEILTVTADPRSPERGRFRFVQPLLRSVAYDTLSRRDRRSRHLAVASRLSETPETAVDEVADVLADHLRAAYAAGPDEPDAADIRSRAVEAYRRAGRRAAALGTPEHATAAYRSGAELAADDRERAELLAAAGRAALDAGRAQLAVELIGQALSWYREEGGTAALPLTADLGLALVQSQRAPEAVELLEGALPGDEGHDEGAARLSVELARALYFCGRGDECGRHVERALVLAQTLDLPEVLARAYNVAGLRLHAERRTDEAVVHMAAAADVAGRHGLLAQASIGEANRAELLLCADLPGAREVLERALELDRRRGSRADEAQNIATLALLDLFGGHWQRARSELSAALQDDRPGAEHLHERLALLDALTGDVPSARRHLDALGEWLGGEDVQARAAAYAARGTVELAAGRPAEAREAALEAVRLSRDLGTGWFSLRQAWPDALDAALALDDLTCADALVAELADRPRGHVPPYLRAQLGRATARLLALRGDPTRALAGLRESVAALDGMAYPYWAARARLDLAALAIDPAEAAAARAAAVTALEQLGAAPALRLAGA